MGITKRSYLSNPSRQTWEQPAQEEEEEEEEGEGADAAAAFRLSALPSCHCTDVHRC